MQDSRFKTSNNYLVSCVLYPVFCILSLVSCILSLSSCEQPKPVNFQPLPSVPSLIAVNHINTLRNFYQPAGITIDYEGNICVADSGNNRIVVGNIEIIGRFGWQVGEFDRPMDIAFDGLRMYIADSGNNRIQRYSTVERTFSIIAGEKADKSENLLGLYSPQGVAVDSKGNVFIVDTWNNRILKTDPLGRLSMELGGSNRFNRPQGAMIDSSGNIYVCDTGNNRICKFDFSGSQIAVWGNSGKDNGQFQIPISIAQDKAKNLYVVDQGNKRIQVFNYDLVYIGEFGQDKLEQPYDIVIDDQYRAYVTDMSSSTVEVFKIILP
ncbi:MAG: NHL repeat-containing protein [Candidatus Poribacteria bacterium]